MVGSLPHGHRVGQAGLTGRLPNALCHKKSSTPDWEAAEWRSCLHQHNGGEVYARIATTVTTPIGTFPAYMDEESVLINRYRPPLNRHTNR